MVIYFIMPKLWHDPAYEPYVFMAAIPWCIAEATRYPFYQFKGLQPYLGHLRYNLFIVLYPVGVTGELLCFYQQYKLSSELPYDQKPWTIALPNKFNVGVDFEKFVVYAIPLIYLVSFPPLYMYMLAQRKKFYAKDKSE